MAIFKHYTYRDEVCPFCGHYEWNEEEVMTYRSLGASGDMEVEQDIFRRCKNCKSYVYLKERKPMVCPKCKEDKGYYVQTQNQTHRNWACIKCGTVTPVDERRSKDRRLDNVIIYKEGENNNMEKKRQPGEGAPIIFENPMQCEEAEQVVCKECKSKDCQITEQDITFRLNGVDVTTQDIEVIKCNMCSAKFFLDESVEDFLVEAEAADRRYRSLMKARKVLLETVIREWELDSIMGVVAKDWLEEMEED